MNIESLKIIDITIALPSYNTRNYLSMAYRSLREYYPSNEIIIMDDGSSDGSWEWICAQVKVDSKLRAYHNTSGKILGHTVTYNIAAKMCSTVLYSIFHSDMVVYRNYLENMLKHWKPKTVVSATRIEPDGIYPPGNEKILKPFGLEYDEFKRTEFESFCEQEVKDRANQTTRGIFAPWLISKDDYLATGGMDEVSYKPWPEEDGDWFLRLLIGGYTLIQSRDALVWHFISRSHRGWAQNGIGNDGPDFKFYQTRARRNYLRKWGRWMRFDEYHHPILHKVYDVGFRIKDVSSVEFLHFVEPWANAIYVDNHEVAQRYIEMEQPTTHINLTHRIFDFGAQPTHDILLEFSEKDFLRNGSDNAKILQNLNEMLSGVENNSTFVCGIFKLTTREVKDCSLDLVKVVNDNTDTLRSLNRA